MNSSYTFSENKEILRFYSKSKDTKVRILSNFSPYEVNISGFQYKTGEHAFQSEKFLRIAANTTNSERKKLLLEQSLKIKQANTPLEAKQFGGKSKTKGFMLTINEREIWENKCLNVQNEICNYKFHNYVDCRTLLQSYPEHYLLHQENRGKQPIWGGRIKNGVLIGQNKLGIIWMFFRNFDMNASP